MNREGEEKSNADESNREVHGVAIRVNVNRITERPVCIGGKGGVRERVRAGQQAKNRLGLGSKLVNGIRIANKILSRCAAEGEVKKGINREREREISLFICSVPSVSAPLRIARARLHTRHGRHDARRTCPRQTPTRRPSNGSHAPTRRG